MEEKETLKACSSRLEPDFDNISMITSSSNNRYKNIKTKVGFESHELKRMETKELLELKASVAAYLKSSQKYKNEEYFNLFKRIIKELTSRNIIFEKIQDKTKLLGRKKAFKESISKTMNTIKPVDNTTANPMSTLNPPQTTTNIMDNSTTPVTPITATNISHKSEILSDVKIPSFLNDFSYSNMNKKQRPEKLGLDFYAPLDLEGYRDLLWYKDLQNSLGLSEFKNLKQDNLGNFFQLSPANNSTLHNPNHSNLFNQDSNSLLGQDDKEEKDQEHSSTNSNSKEGTEHKESCNSFKGKL